MVVLKSSSGDTYSFHGGRLALERIRDLSGVDLGTMADEDGMKRFNAIAEDRDLSLRVIRAAIGDEASGLTEQALDEAWAADEVLEALIAIGKEVARFFTPVRSRGVISMLDRLHRAYREATTGIENRISSVLLPSIAVGTSPESSASTPAI